MKVQLLTFGGCPNAEPAREALRQALARSGVDADVEEIDLASAATAPDLRRWSSPTILIDGADLAGDAPDGGGCRLYGRRRSPTVEMIAERLRAAGAAVLTLLLFSTLACRDTSRAEEPARAESIAEPSLARLDRDSLGQVRETFNAGSSGPRLIVFFSSGCAACDTGSAALQKVLEEVDGPVTVLAVWEPIAASDPLPTRHMLGNLRDGRVRQLWDPDHLMSDEMRASELAHPSSIPQARLRTDEKATGILYDTVALFPPGARWESTLPPPAYLDGGLAAVLDEVRRRLDASSSPRKRAAPSSLPELTDLGESLEAMRSAFNAHRGENRFLTLLAPT